MLLLFCYFFSKPLVLNTFTLSLDNLEYSVHLRCMCLNCGNQSTNTGRQCKLLTEWSHDSTGTQTRELLAVRRDQSFFYIMFLLRVLKFKPFSECHHWGYKLLKTDDLVSLRVQTASRHCLSARLQMKPLLPSSGLMAILEVLKENQF